MRKSIYYTVKLRYMSIQEQEAVAAGQVEKVRTAVAHLGPSDVGYAWDKRCQRFVIGVLFDYLPAGLTQAQLQADVQQGVTAAGVELPVEVAVFRAQ